MMRIRRRRPIDRNRLRPFGRHLTAALLAACAVACGGGKDAGHAPDPDSPQSFVGEHVEADVPNRLPVITEARFVPEDLAAGAELQVLVQAYDADGDPIHFEYAWLVDDRPATARGPRLEVPDRMMSGDKITVTITPFDDEGAGDPYVAEIAMGNRPPRMVELRLDKTDEDGEPGWSLDPEAFDPDGDLLDYDVEWIVNGEVRSKDPEWFSKEGLKRGDEVRVRARARDSYAASPPLESAAIVMGNSSPRILSEPPDLGPGGAFRYEIQASDPDGDTTLSYALVRAPEGMIIDPVAGVAEWTPTARSAGDHEVEISVSDGMGGVTRQSFQVSVRIGGAPAAPAEEP